MINGEADIKRGISIIICCHNSAGKITPTLKALAQQAGMEDTACEIILVDNNSSDDTKTIAKNNWITFGAPFHLKIVEEQNPGLSYARTKGIKNSQYEYLVFCDDDNWLCMDYLKITYTIFSAKPEVGMIGGVGEPVLEKEFPEWFNEMKGFGYAIGSEGRKTGYTKAVYGAGMAVRKKLMQALTNGHISFILSDRVGKKLSSGGDSEMCVLVLAAGKKIWFDDRLTFKHALSSSRITWRYYRKLRYAFGCSGVYLELYKEDFRIPPKIVALKRLVYFMVRYFHLLILCGFMKNEKYAHAVQQFGTLKTIYFDQSNLKEKLPLAFRNKIYVKASTY